MDLSRRDFFKRLAGKELVRDAASIVFEGLDIIRGIAAEFTGSPEDAGNDLRTTRRKKGLAFNASPDHPLEPSSGPIRGQPSPEPVEASAEPAPLSERPDVPPSIPSENKEKQP